MLFLSIHFLVSEPRCCSCWNYHCFLLLPIFFGTSIYDLVKIRDVEDDISLLQLRRFLLLPVTCFAICLCPFTTTMVLYDLVATGDDEDGIFAATVSVFCYYRQRVCYIHSRRIWCIKCGGSTCAPDELQVLRERRRRVLREKEEKYGGESFFFSRSNGSDHSHLTAERSPAWFFCRSADAYHCITGLTLHVFVVCFVRPVW